MKDRYGKYLIWKLLKVFDKITTYSHFASCNHGWGGACKNFQRAHLCLILALWIGVSKHNLCEVFEELCFGVLSPKLSNTFVTGVVT